MHYHMEIIGLMVLQNNQMANIRLAQVVYTVWRLCYYYRDQCSSTATHQLRLNHFFWCKHPSKWKTSRKHLQKFIIKGH